MAKLNQLILLENMMKTYDAMNLKDANLTHFQGVCTEKLVDNINGRLERLVVSKVRMSCRNVLLANYETMTKTTYWLGCRLFSDLPQGESRVQREKVEQMVELLNELVLKIVNVDEEYAKRFFERIKMAYHQKSRTDFELWIARQSHLTIERLKEYQAELTADMLIMGILKYDDMPSGKELKEVDMEKLREHLRKDKELPEDFGLECAKLRRYSHWEGDMFFIDYEKLRKPLFQHFGELTHEQHIAMFEYDVQMKQIHEDIERLRKEEMCAEREMEEEEEMKEARKGQKEAIKKAINIMWAEGELQHKYDHTWIMMTMNETEWLPNFATPTEYLDYMKGCDVRDRLPDRSIISKYYDRAHGVFPNWKFTDAKDKEETRRNNAGKRFLNLVQRA